MINTRSLNYLTSAKFLNLPLKVNLYAAVFWFIFLQSYLIGRLLDIATLGAYRAGPIVSLLAIVPILLRFAVSNSKLLFVTLIMSAAIVASFVINSSSFLQLITFLRIPLVSFLVYQVVDVYIKDAERAHNVLRWMIFLAILQLPVLIMQRVAYPHLPARFKFSPLQEQMSLYDFGMGTLNGDNAMTFFLIALLIILMFNERDSLLRRWKWPLIALFSLTVFVGNSQVQHLTVLLVWATYILIHFRLQTLVSVAIVAGIIVGVLGVLLQAGVLTFPTLQHTVTRFESIGTVFTGDVDQGAFLSGNHERAAAIHYYVTSPIRWFGDGPGAYLNPITRERTIGNWGHLFTFYSEVGLVGWLLSILFLAVIAYPISITRSGIWIGVGWGPTLMFLAIQIVSVVKYPMNTVPVIFTYCIILMSFKVLSPVKKFRVL